MCGWRLPRSGRGMSGTTSMRRPGEAGRPRGWRPTSRSCARCSTGGAGGCGGGGGRHGLAPQLRGALPGGGVDGAGVAGAARASAGRDDHALPAGPAQRGDKSAGPVAVGAIAHRQSAAWFDALVPHSPHSSRSTHHVVPGAVAGWPGVTLHGFRARTGSGHSRLLRTLAPQAGRPVPGVTAGDSQSVIGNGPSTFMPLSRPATPRAALPCHFTAFVPPICLFRMRHTSYSGAESAIGDAA